MGAIPISFCFRSSIWGRYSEKDSQKSKAEFAQYAPADFFDFYTEKSHEELWDNEVIKVTSYEIKPEALLPSFKDFFFELHKLIGNSSAASCDKFNDEYDAIVASSDLDKFVKYFDDHTGAAPTIFPYSDIPILTTFASGCFMAVHSKRSMCSSSEFSSRIAL